MTTSNLKNSNPELRASTALFLQQAVGLVQPQPAGDNSLPCLLDRHVARDIRADALWLGPENRVVNDALDQRVVVNRVGFVPGAEVKNASAAARPAISAAENFPALEPRNEHLLVGRRNSERFAVTLRVLQFNKPVDPAGNRMTGVYDPNALALAGLAPAQVATRAH